MLSEPAGELIMRSTTRSVIVILAAAVFTLGIGQTQPALGTIVVISDEDFADADWSYEIILEPVGSVYTAGQEVTGGNPGSFRKMRHLLTPTHANLLVFNAFLPETYDPAVGSEIISLDYSEDAAMITGHIIGHSVALKQGDSVYRHAMAHHTGSTWTTWTETGLVASDFAKLSGTGPGNPDFSGTGGPITFGYTRWLHSSDLDFEHGIDNWSYTLNVVPEPSSALLWLIGGAICPLAFFRRRRGTSP